MSLNEYVMLTIAVFTLTLLLRFIYKIKHKMFIIRSLNIDLNKIYFKIDLLIKENNFMILSLYMTDRLIHDLKSHTNNYQKHINSGYPLNVPALSGYSMIPSSLNDKIVFSKINRSCAYSRFIVSRWTFERNISDVYKNEWLITDIEIIKTK